MSIKDSITSGVMQSLLEVLPTEYETQNPVSQFLCDQIDAFLEDSKLRDIIKSQIANKANSDPNGVLERLVMVYNDQVLVTLHTDIGAFVRGLNESEDGFDRREIPEDANGDEDAKSP